MSPRTRKRSCAGTSDYLIGADPRTRGRQFDRPVGTRGLGKHPDLMIASQRSTMPVPGAKFLAGHDACGRILANRFYSASRGPDNR